MKSVYVKYYVWSLILFTAILNLSTFTKIMGEFRGGFELTLIQISLNVARLWEALFKRFIVGKFGLLFNWAIFLLSAMFKLHDVTLDSVPTIDFSDVKELASQYVPFWMMERILHKTIAFLHVG